MRLNKQDVLGVHVTTDSKEDILEYIEKYLINFQFSIFNFQKKKREPLVIYTPNPEIILYAAKHEEFKQTVNSAQINLPDGAGVVWALQKMYGKKIPKVAGIDFMKLLCQKSAEKGFRVGLIGGRENVALSALECLRRLYPSLQGEVVDVPEVEREGVESIKYKVVSSTYKKKNNKLNTKYLILNTSTKENNDTKRYFSTLCETLEKHRIDILFVALGFPKQEHFVESIKYKVVNSKYGKPLVLMAVGGSFDYLSGRVKRAPLWMQDAGFEWLYRLIREPWRLGRQIRGGEFFLRVLLEKNNK